MVGDTCLGAEAHIAEGKGCGIPHILVVREVEHYNHIRVAEVEEDNVVVEGGNLDNRNYTVAADAVGDTPSYHKEEDAVEGIRILEEVEGRDMVEHCNYNSYCNSHNPDFQISDVGRCFGDSAVWHSVMGIERSCWGTDRTRK